jgi:hypothetical protein
MQYIGYRNTIVGQGSVVGIATRYGLEGPGIQSRWGRSFPYPSRPALWPSQPPVKSVPDVLPGVQRPGLGVDHAPHLELSSKKE